MSKLIWLTDLHLVEPGRDWPEGIDPLARLRRCLDEVKTLHADAERIVVSGDLIQLNNPGAYGILRAELEQMPTPFRLLVGNHDDRDALLKAFPEIEQVDGFLQGADDLHGARLLYLDTLAADGKHHGELCPARMRWLGDQILSADGGPLLIFQHHPPCDIGVPALDRLRLLDSEGLARLVRARSGPVHLFCGHVHRNVSGLWAGRPFAALKSPHVQFDLDMTGARLARSQEPPGYGVILVGANGVVVNYRDLPPPDPKPSTTGAGATAHLLDSSVVASDQRERSNPGGAGLPGSPRPLRALAITATMRHEPRVTTLDHLGAPVHRSSIRSDDIADGAAPGPLHHSPD